LLKDRCRSLPLRPARRQLAGAVHVAAALLVIGSAVWAFWLDPDKHILTS
jgi:ferric-dicitrate binding protein FerR (iron transport regulator)